MRIANGAVGKDAAVGIDARVEQRGDGGGRGLPRTRSDQGDGRQKSKNQPFHCSACSQAGPTFRAGKKVGLAGVRLIDYAVIDPVRESMENGVRGVGRIEKNQKTDSGSKKINGPTK